MKICIFTDSHWSAYSSILRRRGERYSMRLENLLKSISWVEELAQSHSCDSILCLGDFFDKSDLTSEELTALNQIQWCGIPHTYLVGNHEMGRSSLEYSSAHLFNLGHNSIVIDNQQNYVVGNTEICFLPYICEYGRGALAEYFTFQLPPERRIIFSHNDIKGIQMGTFLSTEGFDIDDIKQNCRLFLNGHLHNYTQYGNIINIGNLTGQNFSEDATRYSHYAIILDTETFEIQYFENPYAFNFYKLDLTGQSDAVIERQLTSVKSNSVITVKVDETKDKLVNSIIQANSNIIESRVILNLISDETESKPVTVEIGTDHLSQFRDYIEAELGTSTFVLEELNKVVVG